MNNQHSQAIIFDFGGVIINIDYEATIKAFQNLGVPNFHEWYTQANQNSLFDQVETGAISSDDFIEKLSVQLPENTDREDIIDAWNAMILNVPKEKIEFLLELKNDYPIYLLSNTNAIHMDKALEEWRQVTDLKMEEVFDKVYLSHEIHMRKPNREIFDFVIQDQKLDTKNTLFIDDSIQHIHGANLTGVKTLTFSSNQPLRGVLTKELGLV